MVVATVVMAKVAETVATPEVVEVVAVAVT